MDRLSRRQLVESMAMIVYGDLIRSKHEVSAIFNEEYPDGPIAQLTVSRIYHMFKVSSWVVREVYP